MALQTDYLKKNKPADIVTMLGTTITLATLSTYSLEELIRIGFFLARYDERGQIIDLVINPIVDKLYELNSSGVWIARTNASGQTTEANSSNIVSGIKVFTPQTAHPIVQAAITDYTATSQAANLVRRMAQISLNTDGSGVCAATALHTAVGAYYPVVRLKRIISTVADATTDLNFTVGGGGALVGPATMTIALVANVMYELNDILLYNLTDATSIACAIANGPISSTVWLEVEYWSET